ncbi:Rnt1p [Sugiyamaella lignohabitans]|uniref:ribonuclease III n=1 Tax=Sugiyamaella lignohabitans TaxID=796027 RepID=A0A161HHL3_9ASCO|nr:Rnt1p [Sugiyamaella lignohabitans]ANB15540.1 Rnt1p [Sugiyamaella lignohabitans]
MIFEKVQTKERKLKSWDKQHQSQGLKGKDPARMNPQHVKSSKPQDISIEQLEQIKWTMITISTELKNLLAICPKLAEMDLSELDEYYDQGFYEHKPPESTIDKTKTKSPSTVLIENLDINVSHIIRESPIIRTAWEIKHSYEGYQLPILDSIMNFESLPVVDKYVSPYRPSTSDIEDSNDVIYWPPPLPPIKDKRLENQVFTHKSVANEWGNYKQTKDNERLEFIGDAVLNFTVSNIIYEWFPDANEGDLTNMRSLLACNSTLWDVCTMYGIDKSLDTGFEMISEIDGKKSKVVADIMEAYIGALYTETEEGPTVVKEWLIDLFKPMMRELHKQKVAEEPIDREAKQRLYGLISIADVGPEYTTLIEGNSEYPFVVQCVMGGEVIGVGVGNSMKTAGLRAAMMALSTPVTISRWLAKRRQVSMGRTVIPKASSSKKQATKSPGTGPKSELYAIIGSAEQRPVYSCIPVAEGFKAKVSIFGEFLGEGIGRTKKLAEAEAAQDALVNNKSTISRWAIATKD